MYICKKLIKKWVESKKKNQSLKFSLPNTNPEGYH